MNCICTLSSIESYHNHIILSILPYLASEKSYNKSGFGWIILSSELIHTFQV